MKKSLILFLTLSFPNLLLAELRSDIINYKDDKTVLQGYIAYDDSFWGVRPGVLVVHEWYGHNDYVRQRANQLAKLGYVAFAVDMYGKGILAKNQEEAGKLAAIFKNDRALMRRRINVALEVFKMDSVIPFVDKGKIAAIGYCFGGTTVLELARSGAELNGVVSFHGNLDTHDLTNARKIKTKVLALHGADDPYVPADQVAAFEKEMREGGVDWQLISYGNAVHGFTNLSNGFEKAKGAAYDEKADKRSWEAMKIFFNEIFK